jgi:hypothetical protein
MRNQVTLLSTIPPPGRSPSFGLHGRRDVAAIISRETELRLRRNSPQIAPAAVATLAVNGDRQFSPP